MQKDLESELSGHFKKIIIALLQGNRELSLSHDRNMYQRDIDDLYQGGEA